MPDQTSSSPAAPLVAYGEAELAGLILSYLEHHPLAMDTVEGIADWWVTREHVRAEVGRVTSVLQTLIAQGLVTEIKLGAERFYQLGAAQPAD